MSAVLAVLILGEHLTTGMLVGFPLILAGSVLGARKSRAAGRRRVAEGSPVPVA